MAVTSGFFNSYEGDRKYDAIQVSEMFDGVIEDGVFMHVGEGLQVFPTNQANTVAVGTGRCWFNHVWVKNWPSRLLITLPEPDQIYTRYDAIVVEINNDKSFRRGRIIYVKGTVSTSGNPVLPTLQKDGGDTGISQYMLAYVTRWANTTTISSSDIHSRVGFSDCPWVVAPAGVVDLDRYWSDWEEQYGDWFEDFTTDSDTTFNAFMQQKDESYNQFEINVTNEWQTVKSVLEAQTAIAVNTSQEAIDGTLAGQLQKQIDDLEFTNNMTPFALLSLPREDDTPELWHGLGSCYGPIQFIDSNHDIDNGDENTEGDEDPEIELTVNLSNEEEPITYLIENFVSPYSYTYTKDGEKISNDKDGFFISQILKDATTRDIYVRSGYYRDPLYDELTEVTLETSWNDSDNGMRGWIKVADDKVSKSGDTMTGALAIESGNLIISHVYESGTNQEIQIHVNDNEDTPFIGYKKDGSQKNYLQFTETDTKLGKPLTIGSGGTGANTAINARQNLGALGSEKNQNYWGIIPPDNNQSTWIRTPVNGLLPYQSTGNTSGIGSGGDWAFDFGHINKIYPLKSGSYMTNFIVAYSSSQNMGNNLWCHWIKYNDGSAFMSFYKILLVTNATSQYVECTLPFAITDYHGVAASVESPGKPTVYVGYTEVVKNEKKVYSYICGATSGQNAKYKLVMTGFWK